MTHTKNAALQKTRELFEALNDREPEQYISLNRKTAGAFISTKI